MVYYATSLLLQRLTINNQNNIWQSNDIVWHISPRSALYIYILRLIMHVSKRALPFACHFNKICAPHILLFSATNIDTLDYYHLLCHHIYFGRYILLSIIIQSFNSASLSLMPRFRHLRMPRFSGKHDLCTGWWHRAAAAIHQVGISQSRPYISHDMAVFAASRIVRRQRLRYLLLENMLYKFRHTIWCRYSRSLIFECLNTE